MLRLGLCCKFIDAPIRFRTTTFTYLQKLPDPYPYLDQIVQENTEALEQSLRFCHENGIGCFRIGSDFLPAATHPEMPYSFEDLPSGENLKRRLQKCGKMAHKWGVRLTFHPNQFVILSSPKEEIIDKSIADLEYHAMLAELVGADVINIHGGGAYGDKAEALKRFEKNYCCLSAKVKKRLTIENDDKTYTPEELLPLCEHLGIPLVYDVHHHRCLPDTLSIEEATKKSVDTWDREPLFHISSPLEGWKGPKPHRHHDYINIHDFPACWLHIDPLTIEVEAKAKEKAVLRLRRELAIPSPKASRL